MSRYTGRLVIAMSVVALLVSVGTVLFVHRVACTIVAANVSVYQETPPTTPAGLNARDSWLRLDRRLYC